MSIRGEPPAGLGNRLAPARFLGFIVMLAGGFVGLLQFARYGDWRECLALAFDFAAAWFLLSLAPLLWDSGADDMRRHARANDANRPLILVLTSLLTVVVMAAIGGELEPARSGEGMAMAKLIVTLLLVWLFANSVYALHYAHAWYTRDERAGADGGGADSGGLDFPGTKSPDYLDFFYFAFTVGMTFQTSDVTITAPAIRRIALLHGFAAFVFNIGVIAFSINALGGAG